MTSSRAYRWGGVTVATAALGIVASACGGASPAATPKSPSTTTTSTSATPKSPSATTSGTLTVQIQTGQQPEIDTFIKLFKKQYPHVTVKTTEVSQTAKTGSNLTVLTSSGAPDVGIIPTNTVVYSRMLAAHDLVPLTNVWKADNLSKVYGKSIVSSLLVKGVPYLVSFDQTYYDIVYYNIPLFKKLGIAAPADHRIPSMADLLKITHRLQSAGYDGLTIGGSSGYQASWMVDSYLNTAATPAQYANYLASWQPSVPVKVSYDAPGSPFVRALKAIDTMGKAKVFEPGYLGISQVPQSEALFVEGRAGMLLDGDYTVATLKQDKISFPYGWMVLPPVSGSTEKNVISLYTGDAYGVPKDAPNPTLGEDFLKVVMSEQGQATDPTNGSLPATSNVPASAFAALGPIVQSQIAFVKQYGGQIGWTSGVPGGFGQQFTDPLVQAMLGGSKSPEQVAAKVQAQLQAFRSGKE